MVEPAVGAGPEPVCSVCVANYNGRAVIEACLDSILRQDFDLPIEIIVHDDRSTDDSARLVRERYPSVILMESRENVGFCVSNNRMVARARGRFVLLLNNDAELFPDALRTLYEAARRQERPGILGLPQFDATTGKHLDTGNILDPFLNPVPNLDERRGEVGMVIGACLWIPRALWEEIGGFPEWFGSLAEDMYLCCAARLKGYPVTALADSGYRHWVGSSFGGGKVVRSGLVTSLRRRSLSERNKTYVMVACYPLPWLLLMLPLHLMLLLVEGMLLSLVKCDPRLLKNIYLGCLASLWRQRQEVMRLRAATQAGRRATSGQFFSVFTCLPHKLRMLMRHGLPTVR